MSFTKSAFSIEFLLYTAGAFGSAGAFGTESAFVTAIGACAADFVTKGAFGTEGAFSESTHEFHFRFKRLHESYMRLSQGHALVL